jgi:hypothetical protein
MSDLNQPELEKTKDTSNQMDHSNDWQTIVDLVSNIEFSENDLFDHIQNRIKNSSDAILNPSLQNEPYFTYLLSYFASKLIDTLDSCKFSLIF